MLFAVCNTVYYTGSEFNKHKHVLGVCIQPVSTIIKFMVTISKWWTILKVLEMELLRSLSSKHTHKHNIIFNSFLPFFIHSLFDCHVIATYIQQL